MQQRDIAVSAAFGAGIGTIVAILLRQHIALGTLVGATIGAFFGGLSFRPREVMRTVIETGRTRWRGFVTGVATLAAFAGVIAVIVRWPRVVAVGAAASVGTLCLLLAWVYYREVARAALWLVGKGMAMLWGAGVFLVGASALPLTVALLTAPSPEFQSIWDVVGVGFCVDFMVVIALACIQGTIHAQSWESSRLPPRWQWPVSRWLWRLAFGDEPGSGSAGTGSESPIPPAWGRARIDGKLVRPASLRKLFALTGGAMFVFAVVPIYTVAVIVSAVLDLPITIMLALASGPRVAVMEGAFLGTLVGAVLYHFGASPTIAVGVSLPIGGFLGWGLHWVRERLEPIAATANSPSSP